MALVRYNPLNELRNVNNLFGRFFNDPMFNLEQTQWQPAVDVVREDDKIVINAELPGVKKDDISIDVTENVLTLKGEKKYENEVNEENYYRKERMTGSFERSFTLPEGVTSDQINAEYHDGILKVEIPKAEKEEPKQIKIK